MSKVAYCSVTYLFHYYSEDLGFDENCSKEDFEQAVEKEVNEFIFDIESSSGAMPNDIEIEVI